MALLQEYHRPASLDEAVALLSRSAGRLAPLAGGTLLVGQLETRAITVLDGVVDLRDIGLDEISESGDAIDVGAMCTLSRVMSHPALGKLADGVLVRAARGEGPINLRNAATVGGVIACAEYDSEFYTALLALDASATIAATDGSQQTLPLSELTAHGGLIKAVTIGTNERRGGTARIARTPSDRPIVAAYATGSVDGEEPVRIALCGVASRPVLSGTMLTPPDDFKGSAAYRLAMSTLVGERALADLEKACKHVG